MSEYKNVNDMIRKAIREEMSPKELDLDWSLLETVDITTNSYREVNEGYTTAIRQLREEDE